MFRPGQDLRGELIQPHWDLHVTLRWTNKCRPKPTWLAQGHRAAQRQNHSPVSRQVLCSFFYTTFVLAAVLGVCYPRDFRKTIHKGHSCPPRPLEAPSYLRERAGTGILPGEPARISVSLILILFYPKIEERSSFLFLGGRGQARLRYPILLLCDSWWDL